MTALESRRLYSGASTASATSPRTRNNGATSCWRHKDTPTSYRLSGRRRRRAARRHRHRARQGFVSRDEPASAAATTARPPAPDYRHHELLLDAGGEKLRKAAESKPLREWRAEGITAAEARVMASALMRLAWLHFFMAQWREAVMPQNVPASPRPIARPTKTWRASCSRRGPRRTAAATRELGRKLLASMRARRGGIGGVEDFFHEFALSSREGLAVMALAESLLRVPDDATLDRLLADKLTAGDFAHHHSVSDKLLAQACASRWAFQRDWSRRKSPRSHRRRSGAAAGRPGVARRRQTGDAADGRAFCLRRDDWRRAGARKERRRPPVLRHAGRGRAKARRTRSAISTPTPAPSRLSAQAAAGAANGRGFQ